MKCNLCHSKLHEKHYAAEKNKKAGMFYSCSNLKCSFSKFIQDETEPETKTETIYKELIIDE